MATSQALAVALPLLVGSALIALSVFVFRSGRDRIHNLVFSGLYLVSGLKSYCEALLLIADDWHARAPAFPDVAFWQGTAFLCATLMLPLLVLFLFLFPRPARAVERVPFLGFLLFLPTVIFDYLYLARPWGVQVELLALALNLLAVMGTLAALTLIVRTYQGSPDPVERARAQYVLLGLGPAFVGTWLLTVLEYLRYFRGITTALQYVLVSYVTPFLELVAAVVTAYAIVKYQLLGVEFKFRIGTKYALTTFGVVGVLFTVNNYVGEFVLEPLFGFTQYYWLVAAVVGGFLFKPLEHAAGWFTDRLFPAQSKRAPGHGASRAAEIYHAQATYILRDARVTDREWTFLQNLRTQLGLSAPEARRIEERVERLLSVDSPRTGIRRGRAIA